MRYINQRKRAAARFGRYLDKTLTIPIGRKAMFVYLINIVLIIVYGMLFVIFGEKTKLKKLFFVIVCFFQCFVICAMRFNVGTDYPMYYNGFIQMREAGFSDLTYYDWEIGYVLLNKLVGLFTDRATVMMAVSAFLSLIGPFYLIWKHSKNPLLSVMIYLNLHTFYLTFNFVRQAIAMSILCFAYGFLKDKKIWQFLLVCAAAAMFHLTALYMIPVFFLTWIKLNFYTLPIYSVMILAYFAFADKVLGVLLSKFHTEYADSRFIKFGVYSKYAIYPVVISLAFVALMFYMRFKLPRSLNVFCHLVMLMGFWQIVMIKHALFERFSYYSMIFLIIAIPEAIDIFAKEFAMRKRKKMTEQTEKTTLDRTERAFVRRSARSAAVIACSVLMTATVAYHLLCLVGPKKGIHGCLPYKTTYNLKFPDIDGWLDAMKGK